MTVRLLFIDDEISVLNSIRRLLSRRCKDWHIITTADPFQGLDILSKQQIDVLVSDIQMPQMQGDKVLEIVLQKYPTVIRIVLSAHADSEAVTRALSISHQYISKPFDSDNFIQMIKDTVSLRNELGNHSLIEKVNSLDSLPAMPETYRKIMSALNNPDVSIEEIAALISLDISLTSKILQVINSAYFSMSKTVENIAEAVTYLGLDVVKSLCITNNLFGHYQDMKKSGLSHKNLLTSAIRVGNIAKHVASHLTKNNIMASNAQLSGFLHNIGMVILSAVFPEQYHQLLEEYQKTNQHFLALEACQFGTNHTLVGAYLLQLWAIPMPIIQAQAYLYNPKYYLRLSNNFEVTPLTCVHIAKAVEHYEFKTRYYELSNYDEIYLKKINLDPSLDKYIEMSAPLIEKEKSDTNE